MLFFGPKVDQCLVTQTQCQISEDFSAQWVLRLYRCPVGWSELALFVIFKMDTLLSIRCTAFLGVEFQKISKLAHVSCMAKVLFFKNHSNHKINTIVLKICKYCTVTSFKFLKNLKKENLKCKFVKKI